MRQGLIACVLICGGCSDVKSTMTDPQVTALVPPVGGSVSLNDPEDRALVHAEQDLAAMDAGTQSDPDGGLVGGAENGDETLGHLDDDMFSAGQMGGSDSLDEMGQDDELGDVSASAGLMSEDEEPLLDCEDLDPCGQACVDFTSDPTNCGFCGRTCVIPGGTAACLAGECAIEQCDAGFIDADGQLENGCEAVNMCLADEPCETLCGSAGKTVCDGGNSLCQVPDETCNAVDDNCDGQCDEGPLGGCRVGVHRAFGNGHVYSSVLDDIPRAAFNIESTDYFYLYADSYLGMRPVHLCQKSNGKFLLSSAHNCEGAPTNLRTIGFWASEPICGAEPLYRLAHSNGNHFFTTRAAERDNAVANLGYIDEGVAGYVWPRP